MKIKIIFFSVVKFLENAVRIQTSADLGRATRVDVHFDRKARNDIGTLR